MRDESVDDLERALRRTRPSVIKPAASASHSNTVRPVQPSVATRSAKLYRAPHLATVPPQAHDAVLVISFDASHRFCVAWVNDAFTRITGFALDAIVGRSVLDIPGFFVSAAFFDKITNDRHVGREYVESVAITNCIDESVHHVDLVMRAIAQPSEDSVRHIVIIYRDTAASLGTSDAQLDEEYSDQLTALPNRSVFIARLNRSLLESRRDRQRPTTVMCLDCDRFKLVNDSYGRSVGDELLVAISRRLQTFLRPVDTLARFGGDEFNILLAGVGEHAGVSISDRIISGFAQPFRIGNLEIFATVSIGIASTLIDYEGAEDIIRDADIAMYRAKSYGKNRYAIFEAAQRLASIRTLQLQTDLRYAVERGEMSVYYQPIFSVARGGVDGMEALLRWRHPLLGDISPSEFVPVAEESGSIVALGTWALREACLRLREWQNLQPEHNDLHVSVNVSAVQLARMDFESIVLAILEQTHLDPRHLHLEITESVLIAEPERVTAVLTRLREHGIKFYVDDFGTGYSSLAYLHRFALDTVKIDKSFVSGIGLGLAHPKIVETIIVLAAHLNLGVIAEGVETEQQASELAALNCTSTQGFLHSPALNRYATSDFLAASAIAGDVRPARIPAS